MSGMRIKVAKLKLIERDLLKALRGRPSTATFSRRLGYSFNQYAKWEAGNKRLLWSEFVKICDVRKVALSEILFRHFKYKGDLAATAIVGHLLEVLSSESYTGHTGSSRFKLQRWQSGAVEPTFIEILDLLQVGKVGIFNFLSDLAGSKAYTGMQKEFAAHDAISKIMRASPYAALILCAVSLAEYKKLPKHQRGWLAGAAGISVVQEDAALVTLEKAGLVARVGGKYEAREIHHDFFEPEQFMPFLLDFAAQKMRKFKKLVPGNVRNSGLVLAVDENTRTEIQKAYSAYFRRLIHIYKSADPASPTDSVVVVLALVIDAKN